MSLPPYYKLSKEGTYLNNKINTIYTPSIFYIKITDNYGTIYQAEKLVEYQIDTYSGTLTTIFNTKGEFTFNNDFTITYSGTELKLFLINIYFELLKSGGSGNRKNFKFVLKLNGTEVSSSIIDAHTDDVNVLNINGLILMPPNSILSFYYTNLENNNDLLIDNIRIYLKEEVVDTGMLI